MQKYATQVSGVLRVMGAEPAGLRHVAAQIFQRAVEVGEKGRVGGRVLEPLPGHAPQQQHGVARAFLQHLRVEVLEQLVGPGVPGPAQIVGKFLQPAQPGGDMRIHAELMDLSHGRIIPSSCGAILLHPAKPERPTGSTWPLPSWHPFFHAGVIPLSRLL